MPSGFKPNLKYEECKRCSKINDYLNEFQICKPCCEQLKQMVPSGFRANLKHEECKRCNKTNDYLNEFQICKPCYEQLKQMVPSGFKPNLKYEECKRCNKASDYLNEFLFCNLCYNQITYAQSGSEVIDNFIRHTLGVMEFVSYNRFKNIEFVAPSVCLIKLSNLKT